MSTVARTQSRNVSPLKSDTYRLEALRLAGLTIEQLADSYAKAFRVTMEAMGAMKTTYFSKDGVVMDQREDIDHATRLAAAKAMAGMNKEWLALLAPGDANESKDKRLEVKVNIAIGEEKGASGKASPLVIDVTPSTVIKDALTQHEQPS